MAAKTGTTTTGSSSSSKYASSVLEDGIQSPNQPQYFSATVNTTSKHNTLIFSDLNIQRWKRERGTVMFAVAESGHQELGQFMAALICWTVVPIRLLTVFTDSRFSLADGKLLTSI